MDESQDFSSIDVQLEVASALALANTMELGKCNRDKLDLRIWVNKQQEILSKGK